eukprot:m51a1_g4233 putative probable phospholipid-transporting atpase ia isoform x2 (1527) ;mRNA; r:126100-132652
MYLCTLGFLLFLGILASAAPAPVTIWASTGANNKTYVVKSGVPTTAGSTPELTLTPLTRNITFGWSSASSKVKYIARRAFLQANSPTALATSPGGGLESVLSLAETRDVPISSSEWWATIDCTSKITGLLQFTLFMWDVNSSTVYDPIDFQVQWSCAVPGCDPLCESLGKGTCEYLLGECRCSDGYSGTYCGYKLDTNRTQRPGVPFVFQMDVPKPTGREWIQISDPLAGQEYDFRYLWTWTHDLDLSDQAPLELLRVVRNFTTYLPPGIYELKVFRESSNTPMGTETITVLSWDSTACASDLDCSGNGLCVGGSCQCYSYRFGGHCERGCSNLTELSNHSGVILSDQGESSQGRAMYLANDLCAWVIAPAGVRGKDWDYVQLVIDWMDFAAGDRIEMFSGDTMWTVDLRDKITTKVVLRRYYDNVIIVGFASDIESGAAGFAMHYTVGKDYKSILAIAIAVPGGVVLLSVFTSIACAIGYYWFVERVLTISRVRISQEYPYPRSRTKGRRDPKLVNLPVEMDGTKGSGLFMGTTMDMSPSITLIPGLSPTGRFTTAVPLAVVLAATACKEAYEDAKRHRQDRAVNGAAARVLRCGAWERVAWADVRVGDVVRVEERESVPADAVVLASSAPAGVCYVETSQLDGETNLKARQALEETLGLSDVQALADFTGEVSCELPNNRLHTFEGRLSFGGRSYALTPRQLLLRGTCLRNTRFVHGVVIYTGHETKLMMNQSSAPYKMSNVERTTNRCIAFLFAAEMALAVVCAIGSALWLRDSAVGMWYLQLPASITEQGVLNLATFVILFNNLIPISLYVSVEFVHMAQAYFINVDREMVHKGVYAAARTSNLNEELGQVKYVFSDKTGTLTQNIMEFRKCSIAGKTDELIRNLRRHPTSPVINEFLTVLAVCHTVVPEVDSMGRLAYQSSSPDESALVEAAKSLGYEFSARTPRRVSIKVNGLTSEFELLNTLEFNSTRKRMSVIVRTPEGKIMLYCKGADTVIFSRLGPEEAYRKGTLKQLHDFATQGLRTLCLACAELSPMAYEEWSGMYQAAATSIGNREQLLDETYEAIEKNLTLLGATAIEDKLQDGVPDTIRTLLEADVKVWMLTGDKQETAINIGYSCQLITSEMRTIVLNEQTSQGTNDALHRELSAADSSRPLALVIDSATLDFALSDELMAALLQLAVRCKAVVCCRCTPSQKAKVVKLVRSGLDCITLAIGDGANDVSMIQSAHVGVGISGEEGLQAARSSDYAIAQFRFLKRLLFVHGRYSYRRTSIVILYSFYKSITLYLTQFWFTFFNGFSGQSLFDRWTLAMYNVLFTFAPAVIFGVFDKDVAEGTVERMPRLYATGQNREIFNLWTFVGVAQNAVFHSFLAFAVPCMSHRHSLTFSNGWNDDLYSLGLEVYTIVIVTITAKLFLETRYWTWVSHAVYWGCLALYVAWIAVYGVVWPLNVGLGENMWFLFFNMFVSPTFWLDVVVAPVCCLARDVCWKFYRRTYRPRAVHIAQELEALASRRDALIDPFYSLVKD